MIALSAPVPMPAMMRRAMKMPHSLLIALKNEATQYTTSAHIMMRRRPIRSPRAPADSAPKKNPMKLALATMPSWGPSNCQLLFRTGSTKAITAASMASQAEPRPPRSSRWRWYLPNGRRSMRADTALMGKPRAWRFSEAARWRPGAGWASWQWSWGPPANGERLTRRQDGHGQARDADQFVGFVDQVDMPDLGAAPDVHRPRLARDPAAAGRAQVVGVDVQAHGAVALGAGVVGADGAQRFGQHHAHAAVQQPEWLLGAVVDRHAAAHEVIAHFDDLYAQVPGGSAMVGGIEQAQVEGFFPDRHGVLCQGSVRHNRSH